MMEYQKELKKPYTILIMLAFICVAIFGVQAWSEDAPKDSQSTVSSVQSPSVSTEAQIDSPLRVLQINTDSFTAYEPEVELTLTNVSIYPISAYSVSFDTLGEKWQKGGVDLSDAVSAQAILQPGQSKSVMLGGGIRYSAPIKAIKISIDFVEFINGVTWGRDIYQSSERLTGRRAGAQALAQHLKQVLHEKGPADVLASVETEAVDIASEPNHSVQWSEGFRAGMTVMRNRIKEGYSKAGFSGIEPALMQAFDAREEIRGGNKDVRQ